MKVVIEPGKALGRNQLSTSHVPGGRSELRAHRVGEWMHWRTRMIESAVHLCFRYVSRGVEVEQITGSAMRLISAEATPLMCPTCQLVNKIFSVHVGHRFAIVTADASDDVVAD